MRKRFIGVMAVALGAATVAACSEELDGGKACPGLCPEQVIEVRDTIISPISLDSSVVGFPPLGREFYLLLASRGDTLDTRAVIRFDSLTQRYTLSGRDTAITTIDSTLLTLRIDTTTRKVTAPVTVEVYDVDSNAPDTATAGLLGLFSADRRIGARTFAPAEIIDSIKVPLSNAAVLAKITGAAPRRLRVGLRLVSAASAQLRVLSQDAGTPARLSYDPSPDTAIHAFTISPDSRTPESLPSLAVELVDYTIIARGAALPPPNVFSVGGVPAKRSFLRFDVPPRIVDSSTVLRATLLLTQRPNRSIDLADSLLIYPQLVTAGPSVTDVAKASLLLAPRTSGFVILDSLLLMPADSGLRSVEIASLIEEWRIRGAKNNQRSMVLQAPFEGAEPAEIYFFSIEAPEAVRPRLRLSYVRRIEFGLP